jgi:hypothetical protein
MFVIKKARKVLSGKACKVMSLKISFKDPLAAYVKFDDILEMGTNLRPASFFMEPFNVGTCTLI